MSSIRLTTGTRLGPYEIVSFLGAGGMGEVFKARDTRLERHVAIKVLPPDFAQNVQLKMRFEREAKTISQLEHPNICRLYDIGVAESPVSDAASTAPTSYLVMELLEGETLSDRLSRGAFPIDQVLKLGIEIASALECAHKAGVVHRDLKPGNIILTRSGAKLLDFGLAKTEPAIAAASGVMTQLKSLTEQGMIIGTFQYMSPEQLEGEEADARTDIFALGTILYEMLTGRRAFQGKTKTSLIAAIVDRDPPPIADVQPLTPPALEHVIHKCLEKDRESRWHSAHDIAEELKWISETGSRAGVAAPVLRARKKRQTLGWSIALAVLLAATALAVVRWKSGRPIEAGVMRLAIALPPTEGIAEGNGVLALSPDGRKVVYVGNAAGGTRLFLREVSSFESKPLAGTEGAGQPFFSPDGKWIGFFARHKLMKVALSGGMPIVICEATSSRGGSWGDDGSIVFCPFYYGGLSRVDANGGNPVPATKLAAGERHHRWPHILPGSQAFLFTTSGGAGFDEALIVAQRFDTGERKILIRGGSDGRYVPTGHLLYRRASSLLAVPFDVARLQVTGQPVQVMEKIAARGAGVAEYALSRTGTLVYLPAGMTADEQGALAWRSAKDGAVIQRPRFTAERCRLSPNGKMLAGVRGNEIWTFDLQRGTSSRLTSRTRSLDPVWTADGSRITYASEDFGPWNIFWRASDGSDEGEPLFRSPYPAMPKSWSRDGKHLLAVQAQPGTGDDIIVWSASDRVVRPLVRTANDEFEPSFSPDGQWIVYESDESGRHEIYVRPFAGTGRWQITTEGGHRPRWSVPGEIVYSLDNHLMKVRISTSPEFSSTRPSPWLTNVSDDYDVSRDGQTLIAVEPASKESRTDRLHVVVNWLQEFRTTMEAAAEPEP